METLLPRDIRTGTGLAQVEAIMKLHKLPEILSLKSKPHAQTHHRPMQDHVEFVALTAFALRVIHGQSAVSDQAREVMPL